MKLRTLFLAAAASLMLLGPAQAAFPERPITLIVPWAAGGGTDAIARTLAAGLEAELKRPVNVVNRTGGAGIVGHSEIMNARPDGYTIGLATAELATYYWVGSAEFTHTDMRPIALLNLDAGTFTSSAKGPWKDLRTALDAIKQQPAGAFKIATAPGAGYHLAFAGLLLKYEIDPNKVTIIPNAGAAPSFQELAAGGVEIVPFSLPEGKPMIDAGIAAPLAVFSDKRNPAFPSVPTLKEAVGIEQIGGTWRGITAPKGTPDDVAKVLETAIEKVWKSENFQKFMTERGFGLIWADSNGFSKFLAQQHQDNGAVMKQIGLSKR